MYWPFGRNNYWKRGYNAHREGKPPERCEYTGLAKRAWMLGWMEFGKQYGVLCGSVTPVPPGQEIITYRYMYNCQSEKEPVGIIKTLATKHYLKLKTLEEHQGLWDKHGCVEITGTRDNVNTFIYHADRYMKNHWEFYKIQ